MPTDATELANIVETARDATNSLDNADLQRVAFERVLEHLLKEGRVHSPEPATASPDSSFGTEQQRADALARYFQIDPVNVEHIFDVSSDEPHLVLHRNRFASQKAGAIRDIASLVTGARTALGLDTATSHIQDATKKLGMYDASNFMTTLAGMKDISVLGKHGSPNRTVRMKATGAQNVRDLAQRLLSE